MQRCTSVLPLAPAPPTYPQDALEMFIFTYVCTLYTHLVWLPQRFGEPVACGITLELAQWRHVGNWQTASDGPISRGESSLSTCHMPITDIGPTQPEGGGGVGNGRTRRARRADHGQLGARAARNCNHRRIIWGMLPRHWPLATDHGLWATGPGSREPGSRAALSAGVQVSIRADI